MLDVLFVLRFALVLVYLVLSGALLSRLFYRDKTGEQSVRFSAVCTAGLAGLAVLLLWLFC